MSNLFPRKNGQPQRDLDGQGAATPDRQGPSLETAAFGPLTQTHTGPKMKWEGTQAHVLLTASGRCRGGHADPTPERRAVASRPCVAAREADSQESPAPSG